MTSVIEAMTANRTCNVPRDGGCGAEDGSSVCPQLIDGGCEGGGLAGAGGADDQDEVVVAGDRGCGVGLGSGEFDVGAFSPALAPLYEHRLEQRDGKVSVTLIIPSDSAPGVTVGPPPLFSTCAKDKPRCSPVVTIERIIFLYFILYFS